jgi:hypothetical protein
MPGEQVKNSVTRSIGVERTACKRAGGLFSAHESNSRSTSYILTGAEFAGG